MTSKCKTCGKPKVGEFGETCMCSISEKFEGEDVCPCACHDDWEARACFLCLKNHKQKKPNVENLKAQVKDLIKQATEERSHYYTKAVLIECLEFIESCKIKNEKQMSKSKM